MNNKILICGNRSFVATGLYEQLINSSDKVVCFSRGKNKRIENQITGDVFALSCNKLLGPSYDIVINFIVIKDKGVDENIKYIKDLVDFCKSHMVKNLIHVSSIMVYDNNEKTIDETTPIERISYKTGYGEIKIAVDKYLESLTSLPFSITYIRLGYVLAADRPIPFLKLLPMGFALVKGDAKSITPIVKRESVHEAIGNIIKLSHLSKVYLFVPSVNKTKQEYAKQYYKFKYIFLNKSLVLGITGLFVKLGFLSKSFYVRVEGMFIESKYDSTQTEKELNIKF